MAQVACRHERVPRNFACREGLETRTVTPRQSTVSEILRGSPGRRPESFPAIPRAHATVTQRVTVPATSDEFRRDEVLNRRRKVVVSYCWACRGQITRIRVTEDGPSSDDIRRNFQRQYSPAGVDILKGLVIGLGLGGSYTSVDRVVLLSVCTSTSDRRYGWRFIALN